ELFREPLLLRSYPLFIVAGQQFSPIEFDRATGGFERIGSAQRRLEIRDIGSDGRRLDLHGESVRAQDAAGVNTGWFQQLPQRGESHAEAVASGFGRDIGPEHLNEDFTVVNLVR